MLAELGQYLEVMASFVDGADADAGGGSAPGKAPGEAAAGAGDGVGVGGGVVADFTRTVPLSCHVKKTVAAIAAAKGLPPSHRLRLALETPGGAFMGAFHAIKQPRVGKAGKGEGEDEDMWAAAAVGGRGRRARVVADVNDDDDGDIWGPSRAPSRPSGRSAATVPLGATGGATGGPGEAGRARRWPGLWISTCCS